MRSSCPRLKARSRRDPTPGTAARSRTRDERARPGDAPARGRTRTAEARRGEGVAEAGPRAPPAPRQAGRGLAASPDPDRAGGPTPARPTDRPRAPVDARPMDPRVGAKKRAPSRGQETSRNLAGRPDSRRLLGQRRTLLRRPSCGVVRRRAARSGVPGHGPVLPVRSFFSWSPWRREPSGRTPIRTTPSRTGKDGSEVVVLGTPGVVVGPSVTTSNTGKVSDLV